MNDSNNPNVISPQKAKVAQHADVQVFQDMFGGLERTVITAKKIEAEQIIEQTKIQASVFNKFLFTLFGFAAFVVFIGALALFWGPEYVGNQIISSVLAFLGGIGFGVVIGKRG